MKKQIFSKGLFFNAFKRIKIFGIIVSAYILLQSVSAPLIEAVGVWSGMLGELGVTKMFIDGFSMIQAAVMVSYLFIPIAAIIVFGVFNKRGGSDFFQSLPYTRTCIFVSFSAAVLTWGAIAASASVIASVVLHYILGFAFTIFLGNLWIALLVIIVSSLFGLACVLLSVSVTGTYFSNVILSLLVMYLPRALLTLFRITLSIRIPTFDPSVSVPFLSGNINLFVSRSISSDMYALQLLGGGTAHPISYYISVYMPGIIYTLAVAVIYIAVALILFRRRESETATNSAINRGVQHTVRILLCFAISMVGTIILLNGKSVINDVAVAAVLAGIVYMLALIVYMAYELITTKKMKKVLTSLPLILIVVAMNAALYFSVPLTENTVYSYRPAKDEIDSVSLSFSASAYDPLGLGIIDDYIFSDGYESSYFTSKTEGIRFDDEGIKKIVADNISEFAEYYSKSDRSSISDDMYDRIKVGATVYQGGRQVFRYLYLPTDDVVRITEMMSQNDDFKKAVYDIPDPYKGTATVSYTTFSKDALKDSDELEAVLPEILESFRNEVSSLPTETMYNMMSNPNSYAMVAVSYITEDMSDSIIISLSEEYTPKTLSLFLSKMIRDDECPSDEIMDILDNYGSDKLYYADLDIVFRDTDGKYRITNATVTAEKSPYGYMLEYTVSEIADMLKQTDGRVPDTEKGFIILNISYNDGTEYGYISKTYVIPIPESMTTEMLEEEFDSYYGEAEIAEPEETKDE